MESLSNEIFISILLQLDHLSLLSLQACDHRFRDLIGDPWVWKSLYLRDYRRPNPKDPVDGNWRSKYRESLIPRRIPLYKEEAEKQTRGNKNFGIPSIRRLTHLLTLRIVPIRNSLGEVLNSMELNGTLYLINKDHNLITAVSGPEAVFGDDLFNISYIILRSWE